MSGGRQAAETTHRAGFAALVGRTNVGKSTLLNTLVQQKIAIVSESPQTTRHRILGVRTMPGAQIAFLDTPGIHKPQHRMNRMMVSAALDSLRQVDLVLFLVDAAAGIGPGDRHMARILRSESGMPPVILVLNKVDLVRKPDLLPQIESASLSGAYAEIVPVSAREGDNCDRLLDVIVSCLPEGPPLYPPDTLTDQTERRLVGEIIREKILARTRQELPQETAVVIDRWIEREDGLIEIDAGWVGSKPAGSGMPRPVRGRNPTSRGGKLANGAREPQAHRDGGPAGDRGSPLGAGHAAAVGEGAGGMARGRGDPARNGDRRGAMGVMGEG